MLEYHSCFNQILLCFYGNEFLNAWVFRLGSNFLLQGFVISDWEALDRLSKPLGSNYRRCVSTAVNAGTDMVEIELKFL